VKHEMRKRQRVDFLPPPPRRLGNKDANRQAILLATAHRPIAGLRRMRQVKWGLWTPLPTRQKAKLATAVRLMLYPLPPRRFNERLVSGTPPRQRPMIAVGGILGLRTPPPPCLRYKISAVAREFARPVGRCATPAMGHEGPRRRCLPPRFGVETLAFAPPFLILLKRRQRCRHLHRCCLMTR
jgi:hypothetical protein